MTLDPTKPIFDAARIEYSLAADAGAASAFLGSDVAAFWTLSAGSEQPVMKHEAEVRIKEAIAVPHTAADGLMKVIEFLVCCTNLICSITIRWEVLRLEQPGEPGACLESGAKNLPEAL